MLFKFFSRKIIYTILGCIFTVFILASCFSPLEGDDATIVISLSGASGNRAAAFEDPQQEPELTYKVTLTGGPSRVEPVIVPPGKNEIKISVAAGRWKITIDALSEGKPYAQGEKSVDIKAGSNSVEIGMTYYYTVTFILDSDGNSIVKYILSGQSASEIDNFFNDTSFDNWYEDGTDDVWDFNNPITKNITLYPKWKKMINIVFWENEKGTLISGTISIWGEQKLTVDVNWEDITPSETCWYIWGNFINESKGKNQITISAKDYNPGTYQLMVIVYKNGKPYSAEISFTVGE